MFFFLDSRGVLDLQGTRPRPHMTAWEAEAVTLAASMSGPDGRQRGMTHICHSLLIPWEPYRLNQGPASTAQEPLWAYQRLLLSLYNRDSRVYKYLYIACAFCLHQPIRKQGEQNAAAAKVHVARSHSGGRLGGNPWIARPAIPESFSRRLSCVKRSFAGFALAGLPLATKEKLRPKSQPRLSLIRQAALGGHPGRKNHPPAALPGCCLLCRCH